MARGHPDFGAIEPQALNAPVLDLAELAARLGSPVTLERRGNVLVALTGSRLGPPAATASGSTAAVDVVHSRSLFGGYSLRMFVSDAADIATCSAVMPYLGSFGVGVEAVYTVPDVLTETVEVQVSTNDGTSAYLGVLRWHETLAVWQYLRSNGTFGSTPTQPDGIATTPFYTVKVAVDAATGLYLYSTVNGQDTGVRDIAAASGAGGVRLTTGSVIHRGGGAADASVHLSALIFTINEE